MKLEYDEYGKREYIKEQRLHIMYVIICACVIINVFIITLNSLSEIFFIILILMSVALLACILTLFIIELYKINRNVIDTSFINRGKKQRAYIIGTDVIRGGRHRLIKGYKLLIFYEKNNITTGIYFIQDNKAFELLKLLLNPYPVKEFVKIPIDTYIYNNKVYADLESIDLTKVKGYEECVKVLDKLYKTE